MRCALESLALRYRWVLERLEELTGQRLDVIHIVGGGSQNTLLCQLTADACNRPVLAGPVEATAIGNVLVQAIGLGLLGSLAEVPRGGAAVVRGEALRAAPGRELGGAVRPLLGGCWPEPARCSIPRLRGRRRRGLGLPVRTYVLLEIHHEVEAFERKLSEQDWDAIGNFHYVHIAVTSHR